MKIISNFCLAFPLILISFCAFAIENQEKITIQWVGPSFVGDSASITTNFPVVHEFFKDQNFKSAISKRLSEATSRLKAARRDLDIVDDKLLLQADDSYMLSFALSGENVQTQFVDDKFSVSYELQALVLVGNLSKDPQRQKIVSSYPVRVRFEDISDHEPTPLERKRIFNSLLLNPVDNMPDIVSAWAKRAEQIKLREKNVWLKVELDMPESASGELDASPEDKKAILLRSLALLEAGVSKSLDIPVIPFSAGHTNQMLLSLANTDARSSFNLPPADYTISLSTKALKFISVTKQAGSGDQTGHAYGVSFSINFFEEPVDNSGQRKNYFEATLKRVDSVFYSGNRRLSKAQQFARVINNFIYEFTQNLGKPDTKWIAASKSDGEKKSAESIADGLSGFAKKFHNL